MTIGSANANARSFELDSELNVSIADAALVAGFRQRLWAYNLGVPEATVGGWNPGGLHSSVGRGGRGQRRQKRPR